MIRKTCFALLIVAVLFAAVSCKTAAIEDDGIKLEGECKNYKYTIAADGLELTLDVEGNPTTGYQWVLLTDDGKLDESVTLRGSEYKQNKAPEMMVGVGGYFTFDVDFSKDGEFDLQFSYCRSWAPEDNPVYMTLSVKVEGNKITEVSVN
ncbi:MAG: protease inhibitor I42 family protein [Sphaerochaetaceae bacterium]|nr:protease inhibitor I42 family protein [Sphaerochaetaceae bacterium]